MTATITDTHNHTCVAVYQNYVASEWVAECSCSNPDGEGVGEVAFKGLTANEVVQDWQDHAAQFNRPVPSYPRSVMAADGVIVGVEHGLKPDAPVSLQIMSPHGLVWADMTENDWDTLRGARP